MVLYLLRTKMCSSAYLSAVFASVYLLLLLSGDAHGCAIVDNTKTVYKELTDGRKVACSLVIKGCYGRCNTDYRNHVHRDGVHANPADDCTYSFFKCGYGSNTQSVSRSVTDCKECNDSWGSCTTPASGVSWSITVTDVTSCSCESTPTTAPSGVNCPFYP